jgi:hypothetical protein
MKRLLCSLTVIAGLTGIALTQQSCVKELAKVLFNPITHIPAPLSFTVPVSASGGFILLDSIQGINIDAAIREATGDQFGLDDADSIYISSMRLTLDSADNNNNWANFTRVSTMMRSSTSSNVVDMGTKENIPDTYSDDLQMVTDKTINMKQYFSGNSIYYLFYGNSRRPTTRPLKGKAFIEYYIK